MSSPVALLIIATQQSSGRGHRAWGSSWGATVATDAWGSSWGTAATAVVGGSVSGDVVPDLTEQEVIDGGQEIIITVSNDSWVAAGAAFDAQRQNIIDGISAVYSGADAWNVQVRDKEAVSSVIRTSDKIITITLTAAPGYDIVDPETITVTIPATALVASSSDVVATPTFTVTPTAPRQLPSAGSGGKRPWWEDILWDEPLEPLIEEIERVKVEVRDLREESVPKDEIAPLIAKLGGVTRSVRALERRLEKATTEFEASQAVAQAQTIARRIAAIEAQVSEARQRQAHKLRLLREDDEVLSLLVEVL